MMLQPSPYFIPLMITTVIAMILAVLGFRRREVRGAVPFIVIMAAIAWWSFFYALELASADLATQILWIKVQYLGILVIPVTWLVFVLDFTGYQKWLTRKNIVVLAIVPFLTFLFVWTLDWHTLIYTSISPGTVAGVTIRVLEYGPWFWLNVVYGEAMLVISTLLIIRMFFSASRLYRIQISFIIIAAVIPWIVNLIYLMRLLPAPYIDPTPIAFTLTGLFAFWGLFWFRFLDVVPVARDTIFTSMADGVLVLDEANRVVDLNPSAQQLLEASLSEVVGYPVETILAGWPDIAQIEKKDLPAQIETTLKVDGKEKYYDLQVSSLSDHTGALTGYLVVIRDITEIHLSSDALREANKKLNLLSSITRHDILNQITGIKGYGLLLRDDLAEEPYMRDTLDKLLTAAETIRRQITFTADYQNLGVMEPVWQDISVVVRNAAMIAAREGIEVVIDTDSLKVYADPLLEKVFYSIFENAVRHGGGVQRISVSYEERDEGCVLFLQDDGRGIPEADKTQIFEPGFGNNTGYGLFLASEILGITGVSLTETGIEGQGARFEMVVPSGKYRIAAG